MKFKKNKKGSVTDALFIGFFFVVAPLALFSAALLVDTIVGALNESPSIDSPEQLNDFNARFPSFLEGMYIMVLVLSYVVVFTLAFFIDSHPVFFGAAAFIFTLMIAVVPFFVNATEFFINDAAFDGIRASFPLVSFIISNYVILTASAWMLIAVGLYSKRAVT